MGINQLFRDPGSFLYAMLLTLPGIIIGLTFHEYGRCYDEFHRSGGMRADLLSIDKIPGVGVRLGDSHHAAVYDYHQYQFDGL